MKRLPPLKDAHYHAHDWFWDNPQLWDPINWAHPLTTINPSRSPHGAYSTSTPPTIPRAKPQYNPPLLPSKVSTPPRRKSNNGQARSLHASSQHRVDPGLPPTPHAAPRPHARPLPFPPHVALPLRCLVLWCADCKHPRSVLPPPRLTSESDSGPTSTPSHLKSQFLPII